MTMGDRIKTWQQLRDEEVDASHARATNGDDRHDDSDSARPYQARDGTVEHVNHDAARQELAQLRERMAVIKQEAAAEVDSKWVSPWRTQATFDLKVKTRLTGHQEYRSLQDRVRDATARLPAEPNPATEAGAARKVAFQPRTKRSRVEAKARRGLAAEQSAASVHTLMTPQRCAGSTPAKEAAR